MPRSYPPEVPRKVLDLLKAGRSVTQIASDLQISEQPIYLWRKRDQIDAGLLPGLTSLEQAELVAARRRIRELEAELAIHQRAAERLKTVVPQKPVRGHQSDGRRATAGAECLQHSRGL